MRRAEERARITRLALCGALAAAATLAPAAAFAQDDVPPRAPDDRLIPTTAASPPALTRAAVEAQPYYRTSEEQFEALKKKAHPPAASLPNWNGVWLNAESYQFDPGYLMGKLTTAPLRPDAKAAQDKVMADLAKGVQWDVLSECLPAGYPRNLAERRPYEFVVTPKQTWLLMELMNEVHRVYTDGRGHIPDDEAIPLWGGDSIGFWDGDTLIVHSTHLKAMDNGYQRSGPPQSDQTSTVEQWRMVDPDHIVMQITVYDPVNLIHPWRPAPRTYYRPQRALKSMRLEYFACEKSGAVQQDAEGGTKLILPWEPGFNATGAGAAAH